AAPTARRRPSVAGRARRVAPAAGASRLAPQRLRAAAPRPKRTGHGVSRRAQPERDWKGDAPQRGIDLLDLDQPFPALGATGEMLVDLGDVAGGEPAADVRAEVLDRTRARGPGVVADVRLKVTVTQPGARPHRELGHAVGTQAEELGDVA